MRRLATLVLGLAVLSFVAFPAPVLAAGQGEKITMDQVPAPVKTTLEKEAKGGTIGDITKETEKGKTFYEAQIVKGGKDRFVHVSDTGKVLKRESPKKEAKEETKAETK
jgi:uncharacterized membrane protein YkoI